MDDNRDLIEKIRKSGEDEQIPEALEPDNMRKRLEAFQRELDSKAQETQNEEAREIKSREKKGKGMGNFHKWQIGGLAAAVVLVAGLGVGGFLSGEDKNMIVAQESYKLASAEKKETAGDEIREIDKAASQSESAENSEQNTEGKSEENFGEKAQVTDEITEKSQKDLQIAGTENTEESDETIPENTASKREVSEENASENGFFEESVSEESTSEDSVSEDSVSEDSVSEESVSEESVSEDSISEEVVLDDDIVLEEGQDSGENLKEIPHAESYEELYERIKPQEAYDTGAGDMMYKDAVQEDSVTAFDINMEAVSDSASALTAGSSQSSSYSETNTREINVDEGDIVKTDGEYIYVLNRTKGIAVLRKDGTSVKEEGWISLQGIEDYPVEFYVDGNLLQLIVMAENTEMVSSEEAEEWDTYYIRTQRKTRLITYDISNREEPLKKGEYEQDGYYLTSRKNGEYVYLFTSHSPEYSYMTDEPETFVPQAGGGIILCEDIYYPFNKEEYTGNTYVVISSVESSFPDKAVETKALLSRSDFFYVSEKHIFVTNSRWEDSKELTSLASFAYNNGKIQPAGAGNIPGALNDSFSLDEYNGYLRVVTSRWDYDEAKRWNALYILDEKLNQVSRIDNLAEGEDIRSARFMGNIAYFVTYRNTDPLFSADLSDPQNPVILGELKVTGFSEYLHFYGENLLLGIGWETDPETGIYKGLKLSMFDVSDPSNVTECNRMVIENVGNFGGSWDYRAVLVNPERNLIGISFTDQNGSTCYGVFSYQEDEGFCQEMVDNLALGSELGDLDSIRGLFIDKCYYITGNTGIAVYDMENAFKKTQKLTW